MPTPQELYADKLAEIARRFELMEDSTIKAMVGQLQQMRGRLFTELGQGGTEFNEFRLRQMIGRVDTLTNDFRTQLTRQMNGNINDVFALGGGSAVEPLQAAGVQGVFFSPSPAQLNAVLDFSADLVQNIAEEMRQKINTQLRLAALGERTPFAAMRGITQALGVKARDGVWGTLRRPEIVKGVAARAEAILRTELTRVYNLAHHSQAQVNAKIVKGLKKRWVATADRRTRPAHLQAHAETADKPIPVNQAFDVGGAKLRFPGDPLGPPGQTINCRCTVVTVLPEVGQEGFTNEYWEQNNALTRIDEEGEFYEGERQDVLNSIAVEHDISQAARGRGFDPSQMNQGQWSQLANELQGDALDELGLATETQRRAGGNRAVGRRVRGLDDRAEFIQLGGQSVERRWVGGSRTAATRETRRINRETQGAARDFMSDRLTGLGYSRSEVDHLSYQQQRRLLAEIGNEQPQTARIGGLSRARRREILDSVSEMDTARAREIAYNPRAGQGLETWSQYEQSMIRAGRENEIEAPPDTREDNTPGYVIKKEVKNISKPGALSDLDNIFMDDDFDF